MQINKVLYFSFFDFADNQGCSINELEFCHALTKKFGNNVWFVLQSSSKSIFEHPNIIYVNPPKLTQIYQSFKISQIIKNIYKNNSIDMIVSRINYPPIIHFLLVYFFSVKLAIKTAGTTLNKNPSKALRDRIYDYFNHKLRKFVYKKAVMIDAPTVELGVLINNEIPNLKPIKIIPNGTNTSTFKLMDQNDSRVLIGIPKDAEVIGFVGALPSEDGGRQMILVAEALKKEFLNLQIVIAGEDEKIEELKDMARQKQMSHITHFLGKVDYALIPHIISSFDIGFSLVDPIVLKRNGNSSQKVRQYLACGKPVISIKSGHSFLIEHDLGSVVEPEDIENITLQTLLWLKRIKNNRENFSQRLRDYACQHLSVENTLQERIRAWEAL